MASLHSTADMIFGSQNVEKRKTEVTSSLVNGISGLMSDDSIASIASLPILGLRELECRYI